MDTDKLFKALTSNEDLKDIPLTYIMRITIAVFEIINSGECFYQLEEV